MTLDLFSMAFLSVVSDSNQLVLKNRDQRVVAASVAKGYKVVWYLGIWGTKISCGTESWRLWPKLRQQTDILDCPRANKEKMTVPLLQRDWPDDPATSVAKSGIPFRSTLIGNHPPLSVLRDSLLLTSLTHYNWRPALGLCSLCSLSGHQVCGGVV